MEPPIAYIIIIIIIIINTQTYIDIYVCVCVCVWECLGVTRFLAFLSFPPEFILLLGNI